MQFSLGFWDWLFGEKAVIELPDGRKRTVTVRWVKEMERQGKLRHVHVGKTEETIRVHSIGKTPDFDGDVHQLDEWLADGGKTYTVETWRVGEQVSEAEVMKWRDPETGDLFVVNQIVDGQWKFACCTRKVWERFKAVDDSR